MADLQQKFDLDLRFGGSTLGDFGYFYDVELPYIYKCLNALRKNQVSPAGESVEPAPNQIKVEDSKLYVRSEDNSSWVFMFNIAYGGGIRQEGQTLLNNDDLAGNTLESRKGKIAVYDEDGNLPGNILGSANSMAGYRVDTSGLQDGQIMAFNAGANKWEPTDKFSGVGAGKSIAFEDNKGVIVSYNGGTTTEVDMPVQALLPNTLYNVGDVAKTRQIATSSMLVCVQQGTTPAAIPNLE